MIASDSKHSPSIASRVFSNARSKCFFHLFLLLYRQHLILWCIDLILILNKTLRSTIQIIRIQSANKFWDLPSIYAVEPKVGITGEILVNSNGDRETDYTLDDLDPETGNVQSQ
jgi:hypothetical protein